MRAILGINSYIFKDYFPNHPEYDSLMRNDYRSVLIRNLELLMERDKIASQNALSKKMDINQKTINNLFNFAVTDIHPTGLTLSEYAEFFNVPVWMLLVPGMDKQTLNDEDLPTLLSHYLRSNSHGRFDILRVAENEMRYTVLENNDEPTDKSKDYTNGVVIKQTGINLNEAKDETTPRVSNEKQGKKRNG